MPDPNAIASRHLELSLLIALVALAAGCASVPGPDTGAGPSAGTTAARNGATAPAPAGSDAAPGTARPQPTQAGATGQAPARAAGAADTLRSFADVIRDAREIRGYFTLWQKDEKVMLEIGADQLDMLFLFQASHARGIGEKGAYGGMMGWSQITRWKRIGNSVQLLARNFRFRARDGTPMARFVGENFSESLLGQAPVISQPHPARKSVLIDLNALLLTDLAGTSRFIQGVQQRGYSFDARNSSIDNAYGTPELSSLLVLAHYANAKAGAASPGGLSPIENVPDPRSLFLGLRYSFAKLQAPMKPRLADPRIGHFTTEFWDFSDDLRHTPRRHYVNRWRLEKKDPAAPLSEPVQPIVFWIDRNVPEKYRGSVRDGILEWNKAFERIGFKDAIVARQQPDDADFETSDARHATVRWFVGTDVTFAIGPSNTDPRTGEILDADVAIPENWSRGDRRFLREDVGNAAWPAERAARARAHAGEEHFCDYATEALDEARFGLDLLLERGELTADGPEIEAFVMGALKDVVMHEIGHALGLRHNFRASTAYPLEKLSDKAFTAQHGLGGSVMDYLPVNLAANGERQGEFHQSTLGPYDYWAVEYAYKPLDPATEAEELAKIAARGASVPELAFSSDEENSSGIDPSASTFDFGSDSLSYLERRFRLTAELWGRLEHRVLRPGEPYDVLRRSFDSGLRQTVRAAQVASKYVGGVAYVRDFAGTGRNPLMPVGADRQRAALALLTRHVFAEANFRLPPEFQQRMGVDYLLLQSANPDFSLTTRVLSLQAGTLGQLMHETVAARLLDSETKSTRPADTLKLSELYDALRRAIWSEVDNGADIPLIRRNLQREHAMRIASVLTRPAGAMPADARALLRAQATELRGALTSALERAGLSRETHAHLAEMRSLLDEALRAPLLRPAV